MAAGEVEVYVTGEDAMSTGERLWARLTREIAGAAWRARLAEPWDLEDWDGHITRDQGAPTKEKGPGRHGS